MITFTCKGSTPGYLVVMEIIGAVASASQLGLFIINISKQIGALRAELRDGPKRIRQQENHLISLEEVIKAIQPSRFPDSQAIPHHLNRIQESISDVQGILGKSPRYLSKEPFKRVRRAITAIRSEDRILAIFKTLETDKSNLVLIILGSQGETLKGIHQLTERMSRAADEIWKVRSYPSPA